MKIKLFLSLFICSLFSMSCFSVEAGKALKSEEEFPSQATLSRAFGYYLVKNMQASPACPFDFKEVIKGIQDSVDGKPAPLSDEDYDRAISQVQQNLFEEVALQNLEQANDFLAENASKQEVKELVPGKLQVSILEKGTGPEISEESTPLLHYTGRYLNQTIFGSSEEMEPVALQLDTTIEGFKQGLIGAKEGEIRRLYVHPDYGYGTWGDLLPNALMIFDIKILKSNVTPEMLEEPAS